jgi:hypothetical protein
MTPGLQIAPQGQQLVASRRHLGDIDVLSAEIVAGLNRTRLPPFQVVN